MPHQRASIAVLAEKHPDLCQKAPSWCHVQTLLSIDKEQAGGYCCSGMDPPEYRQREQRKARAQTHDTETKWFTKRKCPHPRWNQQGFLWY